MLCKTYLTRKLRCNSPNVSLEIHTHQVLKVLPSCSFSFPDTAIIESPAILLH